MTAKKSILFLDIARIIACFAVVAIHAVSFNTAGSVNGNVVNWSIQYLVLSTMIWAVPIFIMISGALHLQKPVTPASFYLKKFQRVGIPLLIWTSIYWVLFIFLYRESFSLFKIVERFFLGPFYHLYFLVILLGLFVITPILQKIISKIIDRELLFLTSLFLLISAFWNYSRLTFTMFIPYIGYYLAGYYLYKVNTRKIKNIFLLLGSVLSAGAIFFGSLFLHTSTYFFTLDKDYFVKHNSFFVIIFSIFIFILLKNNIQNNTHEFKLKKLADLTFGIYILHYLVQHISVFMYKTFIGKENLNWYELLGLIPFSLLISIVLTVTMKKYTLFKKLV